MSNYSRDPILLTPGPLTTSLATKAAMLRDWGSWDAAFNAVTASICKDVVEVVRGSGTHPTRLVLFRRPIEHRCDSRADLEAMVLTLVVEQVAELLGIDASEVDSRYGDDDLD